LGIKVLGNTFVGNTNYWEKTKVGKRVFLESCIGKKALGKTTFGKNSVGKNVLGKVTGNHGRIWQHMLKAIALSFPCIQGIQDKLNTSF